MEKKINKQPTERQLIKAMNDYREMLHKDPKVSSTKFDAMQTALFGAKQLIRDAFGSPRISEIAWIK